MCFLFLQLVHHPKEGDKKLMMLDVLFVPNLVLQLHPQLAHRAEKKLGFCAYTGAEGTISTHPKWRSKLNHELSWEEKLNISLSLT